MAGYACGNCGQRTSLRGKNVTGDPVGYCARCATIRTLTPATRKAVRNPDTGQCRSCAKPLPDGRRVRLDQVATVSDTLADARSAAALDGKPVVGFEVVCSKGESEVAVGRLVRQALAEFPDLPDAQKEVEAAKLDRFALQLQKDGRVAKIDEHGKPRDFRLFISALKSVLTPVMML